MRRAVKGPAGGRRSPSSFPEFHFGLQQAAQPETLRSVQGTRAALSSVPV
jgi:hypothetical protein